MRVVKTDAKYYVKDTGEVSFQGGKGEKEEVSGGLRTETPSLFPFIISVDGLLCVEVGDTLKRTSRCIEKNWQQPYYGTCGYVKSRVEIALVWSTNQCIRYSRVTSHQISVQHPHW